jgi:hypothetical protein
VVIVVLALDSTFLTRCPSPGCPLRAGSLNDTQRETVQALRAGILALAHEPTGVI